MFKKVFWFDADGGGAGGGSDAGNGAAGDGDKGQAGGGQAVNWESILGTLSEDQRRLYDEHITGLRNTVKATRQERDEFAKQLKDLAGKAEKGSELEKTLGEINAKLEQAERRASFAEEAIKPEVGCVNVKAAWALATAEDLFDKRGNVDWAQLKKVAPELFRKSSGPINAGSGTDNPQDKADMNSFIRRAAGR